MQNKLYKERLIIVGILLLVSLFGLIQLTYAAGTEKGLVEINVWGWGIYPEAWPAILDDFNEKYPNIKVNIEMIGWGDMVPKLMAAMTSGQGGPDLATIELGSDVLSFAKRGGLKDLTEYMSPVIDQYTESSTAGAYYNNKLYAVPSDIGPYGMFYRTDIFKEAGIDPESIKTWSDFIKAGKKITRDTNGDGEIDQFMLTWPKEHYNIGNWYFGPMLEQIGGNIFDDNGNVVLDKLDLNYKVVETMKEITNANIGLNMNPFTAEWNVAIKSDKIATILAGSWFMGNLPGIAPEEAGKWRLAPAPAFTPGIEGMMGRTGFVMPKNAKHPEAAIKFAKFVTSEGMKTLAVKSGLIPAYKPIYKEKSLAEYKFEYYDNQKMFKTIGEISENELGTFNFTPYSTQAFGSGSAPINIELINIINGDKSIKAGLEDAAEEIKRIMEQD
jgi:lactose/L-arabinose transport system substrate-binding protein